MKKYEYKIQTFADIADSKDTTYIDSLGKDGWELASVIKIERRNLGLTSSYYKYFFKREKR